MLGHASPARPGAADTAGHERRPPQPSGRGALQSQPGRPRRSAGRGVWSRARSKRSCCAIGWPAPGCGRRPCRCCGALGWTVTDAAGVGVDRQYAVFGAFGAITFMALSGVLLDRLRAAAPAAPSPQHGPPPRLPGCPLHNRGPPSMVSGVNDRVVAGPGRRLGQRFRAGGTAGRRDGIAVRCGHGRQSADGSRLTGSGAQAAALYARCLGRDGN